MKIMVALSGTFTTVIVLLIFNLYFSAPVISFVEIGFRLISLIVGTDGTIALKAIKESKKIK